MGQGLCHKFLLVANKDIDKGYGDYSGTKRHSLHDDFISFVMLSSLKWIPTHNPSTEEKGFGLNLYGPTLIKKDGIQIAAGIFKAWRDMIALAPDKVVFYCGLQYVDEVAIPFNPEFHKSELLENLDGILADLERVGEECSLLHLGI